MLLSMAVIGQEPEPYRTNLELNKLVEISSVPSGFTYYAVNFELKFEDPKLFLITVQTDRLDTIEIFSSIYYEGVDKYFEYPNW